MTMQILKHIYGPMRKYVNVPIMQILVMTRHQNHSISLLIVPSIGYFGAIFDILTHIFKHILVTQLNYGSVYVVVNICLLNNNLGAIM